MTDRINLLKNDKISWIRSRRSFSLLKEPAPSKQEILTAIECAMTAPDHKKLKPWRFIVTQGDSRLELAEALLLAAKAKAKRAGDTLDEQAMAKTKKMPFRAPVIITVVTSMSYHEKVPTFEQILSTGACVQNLILALKSLGFSSIWRTGLLCNEAEIKRYFNVSSEDCVAGFIYVGTNENKERIRPVTDITSFVKFEN